MTRRAVAAMIAVYLLTLTPGGAPRADAAAAYFSPGWYGTISQHLTIDGPYGDDGSFHQEFVLTWNLSSSDAPITGSVVGATLATDPGIVCDEIQLIEFWGGSTLGDMPVELQPDGRYRFAPGAFNEVQYEVQGVYPWCESYGYEGDDGVVGALGGYIYDTLEHGRMIGSEPNSRTEGNESFEWENSWDLTLTDADLLAVDDDLFVEHTDVWYPVHVLTNDVGQGLRITGNTDADHGDVSCSASDCEYRADAGAHPTDSFTYTITDSRGDSDTAVVNVRRERCTVATGENVAKWPTGDVLRNHATVNWCWTGESVRIVGYTVDQDDITSAAVFFPLRALGIVSDFHFVPEGSEPAIFDDGPYTRVIWNARWEGCFDLPLGGSTRAFKLLDLLFALPGDHWARQLQAWVQAAIKQARMDPSMATDFAFGLVRGIEIAFHTAQDFVCSYHFGWDGAWDASIEFQLAKTGPDASAVYAEGGATHYGLTPRATIEDPGSE